MTLTTVHSSLQSNSVSKTLMALQLASVGLMIARPFFPKGRLQLASAIADTLSLYFADSTEQLVNGHMAVAGTLQSFSEEHQKRATDVSAAL
jgi:hypothetical protein